MRNCKRVWEIAIEREWTSFCLPYEEPTIILVVQEFYLELKEREATRPYYELRTYVKVKGFNVLVTERKLCKRVRGPKERMDKEMNPPKKFLGDDVYKQFDFLSGSAVWERKNLNPRLDDPRKSSRSRDKSFLLTHYSGRRSRDPAR
ncbi:hypothetical protein Goshw_020380, partial [Gossypium schwendimanii]|nr:hypothetical protein [Gossypium schwendimanii]